MNRVSRYLKTRVLGAIEYAPRNTIIARIEHVSQQVFTDEDGQSFQFTWRSIQTWYSRYKKDGITTMKPRRRSDRGRPRKVYPEELAVAIEKALPEFHEGKPRNIAQVYRVCIEKNLLRREQVAPNTFRRLVNQFELLKPELDSRNKRRGASPSPKPTSTRCGRRTPWWGLT